MTGKNFNRPRYTVLREDVLWSDDCLIITELDRLERNKQGILDTINHMLIEIYAAMAEAEMEKKIKWQTED